MGKKKYSKLYIVLLFSIVIYTYITIIFPEAIEATPLIVKVIIFVLYGSIVVYFNYYYFKYRKDKKRENLDDKN